MSSREASKGEISLREHLDPSQTNCLNEANAHPLKSVLSRTGAGQVAASSTQGEGAYVESDADEQLLLNVYFTQKVRIRSLILHTHPDHIAQAPKSIRLFINRPSIGFEDVEDAPDAETAQSLELTEDDVREGAPPIALRYVRFQSVHSIHVFVANNQGGEETSRIDHIDFIGSLNEGTRDLSKLGASEDE